MLTNLENTAANHKVLIPAYYIFEGKDYDLVQDNGTDLIHVYPIPDNDTIARMYSDNYFVENWIVGRYGGSYAEIMKQRCRSEFPVFFQIMEELRDKSSGRFFEIGAAGGGLLDYAKSRGWNVSGLEISDWGVKHASEQYGIEVTQGNAADTLLEKDVNAVVFLGDVFEHVPNPDEVLQRISASLKPNGLIAMLLPMYVSSWCFGFFLKLRPLFRVVAPKKLRILLKLERANESIDPPYHIYEYSEKTITDMLSRNGFKVEKVKGTLPVPDFLKYSEDGESFPAKICRLALLGIYKIFQFGTESFKFPLVRSFVVARKVS